MSYTPQSSNQNEEALESDAEAGEMMTLPPQDSTTVPVSPGGRLSSRLESGGQASAEALNVVTPTTLYHWLRRCTRKFRSGMTVIKVLPNGKIARRQLFIGAKPEYIELTSAKLFDIAYHLGDIESVTQGIQSPEFGALLILDDTRRPKPSKCLVIKLSEATISLIFKREEDRRDAQFLLRVQKRAVIQRYAFFREIFDARQREMGLAAERYS